jgi:hypothetical protein
MDMPDRLEDLLVELRKRAARLRPRAWTDRSHLSLVRPSDTDDERPGPADERSASLPTKS